MIIFIDLKYDCPVAYLDLNILHVALIICCAKFNFLLIVMPQIFHCFIGGNWIIVEKYSISIIEIGLMIFKGVQYYRWRFFRINSYFAGFRPF